MSLETVEVHRRDMQTTPTIEMIPLFGKKVRTRPSGIHEFKIQADKRLWIVCVSDTLIAEIKRIIKSSEIMKYNELLGDIGGRLTMVQGE